MSIWRTQKGWTPASFVLKHIFMVSHWQCEADDILPRDRNTANLYSRQIMRHANFYESGLYWWLWHISLVFYLVVEVHSRRGQKTQEWTCDFGLRFFPVTIIEGGECFLVFPLPPTSSHRFIQYHYKGICKCSLKYNKFPVDTCNAKHDL